MGIIICFWGWKSLVGATHGAWTSGFMGYDATNLYEVNKNFGSKADLKDRRSALLPEL